MQLGDPQSTVENWVNIRDEIVESSSIINLIKRHEH